jgi:lysophospholipase L1-like esterase
MHLRPVVQRGALVLLGLILGLVVAEIALQVAAAYLRSTRAIPASALTGRRRIVCLGDSNTYGLYVGRTAAWPQQLERTWGGAGPLPPVEVINLGYPGTDSSRLRNRLGQVLDAIQPDVVLMMVGANDFWTEPEPARDEPPDAGGMAWRHLRVYRLGYMLWQAFRRPTLELTGETTVPSPEAPGAVVGERGTFTFGGYEIPFAWRTREGGGGDPAWLTRLHADLGAIVARARAVEVPIILVTYPSRHGLYGFANDVIRRVAGETAVPLIDLAQLVRRVCPGDCSHLFFKDLHPTALGHQVAAGLVRTELQRRPDLRPLVGLAEAPR